MGPAGRLARPGPQLQLKLTKGGPAAQRLKQASSRFASARIDQGSILGSAHHKAMTLLPAAG
jgi:hypothetical protein